MNMDILSIIEKKQRRLSLSDEEIAAAPPTGAYPIISFRHF